MEGITANRISPTFIEIDRVTRDLSASSDRIPMGRFGRVKEVAEVTLMIIKNSRVSGPTINVGGGRHFS